jgi:hypothetical protein
MMLYFETHKVYMKEDAFILKKQINKKSCERAKYRKLKRIINVRK